MATWKTWVDGEKLYAADINALQTGKVDSDGTASPTFAGLTLGAIDGTLEIRAGVISGGTVTGVWKRQGIVVASAEEPQVIYEAGAQILTGTVFKMWYSGVGGIRYAESLDGLTWTDHESAVAPGSHMGIYKTGGVYYLYTTVDGDLDLYTSTDGVTFVLDTANSLPRGGGGSWDVSMVANPCVWKEGATWYMIYEATNGANFWSLGLATSADGKTWTKDGGNPVLYNTDTSFSGIDVHKVGAVYFGWMHGSPPLYGYLPSDGYFYKSTNLITWTKVFDHPALPRWTADEGVGEYEGQVADLNVVEANGKTYIFYTGKPLQASANIKLAIADFTITELATVTYSGTVPIQGPAMVFSNGNVSIGGPPLPKLWGGGLPARLNVDATVLAGDALRLKAAIYANTFNYMKPDNTSLFRGHWDGSVFKQTLGVNQVIDQNGKSLKFWIPGPYCLLTLGASGEFGIGTAFPHYPFTLIGMTDYANDAAAGAAGLTGGDFFTETGTNPKRVCVKI
jgi:hypothetical protein